MANTLPMHTLGPIPNGMYEYGLGLIRKNTLHYLKIILQITFFKLVHFTQISIKIRETTSAKDQHTKTHFNL